MKQVSFGYFKETNLFLLDLSSFQDTVSFFKNQAILCGEF